ncbi:MAG: AAA family ATPase [Pirellulales bacterium]|nr:AAA family ATPase [Pirellulales bacterium]
MYQEYWQLDTKPFEPAPDERFRFASADQQAARHKLRYAIESRRGAALLAGPAGVGKTMLAAWLAEQLEESVGSFVQVVFPLMSSRDLLVYLAEQLGVPPADPPQHTVEESLRRLQFGLEENSRRGQYTVIVVDEAHLLEDSGLLETLRLLLNLPTTGQPWFTLLLSGQTPLLSAMQRNRSLDERLDIKILLKPFSAEETAAYIEHRLSAAGASRTIFSEDALQLAHQLSGGIPRRINRLCDLALLVGFAARQHTVDAAQLQSVSDELVTVSAAA